MPAAPSSGRRKSRDRRIPDSNRNALASASCNRVRRPNDSCGQHIRRGSGSAGSEASASTWPASGKQPDRKLSPADPTTRAAAAAVQIASLRTGIPHPRRSDLQHLQNPAAFDQQTNPSALLRRCGRRVGVGCRLNGGGVGFSTWRSSSDSDFAGGSLTRADPAKCVAERVSASVEPNATALGHRIPAHGRFCLETVPQRHA